LFPPPGICRMVYQEKSRHSSLVCCSGHMVFCRSLSRCTCLCAVDGRILECSGKFLAFMIVAMIFWYMQNQLEREQHLNRELAAALATVKKLSGLLPICASCKNIRNDHGYWEQIEAYIQEHSEAEFTHSICPACAERLYPELYSRSQ